jgi:hypothetical protein
MPLLVGGTSRRAFVAASNADASGDVGLGGTFALFSSSFLIVLPSNPGSLDRSKRFMCMCTSFGYC